MTTATMQSTFLTKEDYKLEKTKEEIEREKAKKEIQRQKRELSKRELSTYKFSDLEIKPIFQKAKSNFQLKNKYANNHNFEIDENKNFEQFSINEIVRIFRESPEDPLYLDNYPYN